MTKPLGALHPETKRFEPSQGACPERLDNGRFVVHEVFMRNFHSVSSTVIFSLCSALAQAQSAPIKDTASWQSTPLQVVHLSATASAQVTQDWLLMTLAVQKEGADAAVVQKHIQSSLAAALALAQSSAQKGLLDVSTGQMSVYPRYGRDGKSNGWVGVAELVLQGRDVARISEAAGRVHGMTVSQVQWQVSPELKRQVENRIQGQAVEQFQSRASALASSFGFTTYSLREVRVSSQDSGHDIQPRMASVQMDSLAASPVQAGQSRVVVNVAGSIQLK